MGLRARSSGKSYRKAGAFLPGMAEQDPAPPGHGRRVFADFVFSTMGEIRFHVRAMGWTPNASVDLSKIKGAAFPLDMRRQLNPIFVAAMIPAEDIAWQRRWTDSSMARAMGWTANP